MGLIVHHDRNGRIEITQPPSERNALGRMKFNFPNKFNVYLHDTPDKRLFALDRRAFSHGCMRVQNPTGFGEALLAVGLPDARYSADRLQHMFGRGEEWLKFKALIPVHITYQTAYVDEASKLVVREDIYGLDSRVLGAIKTPDVRVADGAPASSERHRAGKRHVARQGARPSQANGGGSFFDRLFR
jgi:murein L,D-transpeptidase YcbB/YkuD